MAVGDNGQGFNILSAIQNGVQALNGIRQAFSNAFPQIGGTTTTATGGAITPPAQVVGYIVVSLPNGTAVKIAYYD
jgi:hypothetical protein